MNITWNYKIDLVDEGVFSDIEKERNMQFPEKLKSLIKEGNAATPDKYKFMVNMTEKVVGAVLSFNKGETDTDTIFTALEVIKDNTMMPFAIDPFGNYICYDLDRKEVVFWDHETGDMFSTGKDVEDFMKSLY